jgi:2-keto-4-pentenoate hydratase/2-oxohepta-3-ene-1,7-dioic acid hydratase in catechol pathway
MKWVKFTYQGKPVYGLVSGSAVQITGHQWEDVLAGKPATSQGEVALSEVRLLNPIARPGKIVCVGLNYMDHCRETNTPPPKKPLLFAKFATALNDPGGDITWSTDLTNEVDFEAELAVVLGKGGRNVPEKDALGYVAGYTAANDVSARDVQLGDGQWVRGKSLDTFCPLGPVFVTADEIPDPQRLAIKTYLNDTVVQDSNTSEMIFGVAQLVSFCSQAFTWEVGDIILTGTPHGTGMGRTPKLWMQDGDRVVVEVEGIGRLENRCRTL